MMFRFNNNNKCTRAAALVAALLLLPVATVSAAECVSSGALTCRRISSTSITLDADLSDWPADAVHVQAEIKQPLTMETYAPGPMHFRCLYDDEKIYLALEVPGAYRHNSTDNEKCASIATMMKIGSKASYYMMGNCPDAANGCAKNSDGEEIVPDACNDYRVDIGAHWELSTAQQRKTYPINVASISDTTTADQEAVPISGKDLIAAKDDEYAVNAYCRLDDDGAGAGNEWAGAWAHTSNSTTFNNDVDDKYIFELSRLLTTTSLLTDAQLQAGNTYEFGLAFWDPYESMEEGWSDAGHYVTGCAIQWINLVLQDDTSSTSSTNGSSAAPSVTMNWPLIMSISAVLVAMSALLVA